MLQVTLFSRFCALTTTVFLLGLVFATSSFALLEDAGFTVSPTIVETNQSVTISWRVYNSGATPRTGTFSTCIKYEYDYIEYPVNNSTHDFTSLDAGAYLPALSSSPYSATFTPSTAGTYEIYVFIDDDEGGYYSFSRTVTVDPPPRLDVTVCTATSSTGRAGQLVNLSWTVTNSGAAFSGTGSTYIVRNGTTEPLGTTAISSMQRVDSDTYYSTDTPTAAGSYIYTAYVTDGTTTRHLESGSITLVDPPPAFTINSFTVNGSATSSSINLSSAPIPIAWTVNVSGGPIIGTYSTYYKETGPDGPITSTRESNLTARSYNVSRDISLTNGGRYTFRACVDYGGSTIESDPIELEVIAVSLEMTEFTLTWDNASPTFTQHNERQSILKGHGECAIDLEITNNGTRNTLDEFTSARIVILNEAGTVTFHDIDETFPIMVPTNIQHLPSNYNFAAGTYKIQIDLGYNNGAALVVTAWDVFLTVQDPPVTISGSQTYNRYADGQLAPGTVLTNRPLLSTKVEIVSPAGVLLSNSSHTNDQTGNFYVTVPTRSSLFGGIKIKYTSQFTSTQPVFSYDVLDGSTSNPFTILSAEIPFPTTNPPTLSWPLNTTTIPATESGIDAFVIGQTAIKGMRWARGTFPGTSFTNLHFIVDNNAGTWYTSNNIYVLTTENDQYDDPVILHEFGHYVADKLTIFATNPSTGPGALLHSFMSETIVQPVATPPVSNTAMGWNEGWANFVSVVTQREQPNPITNNVNLYTDYKNVEPVLSADFENLYVSNNGHPYEVLDLSSFFIDPFGNETIVAAILLDLFDNTAGEDQPRPESMQDGIGDFYEHVTELWDVISHAYLGHRVLSGGDLFNSFATTYPRTSNSTTYRDVWSAFWENNVRTVPTQAVPPQPVAPRFPIPLPTNVEVSHARAANNTDYDVTVHWDPAIYRRPSSSIPAVGTSLLYRTNTNTLPTASDLIGPITTNLAAAGTFSEQITPVQNNSVYYYYWVKTQLLSADGNSTVIGESDAQRASTPIWVAAFPYIIAPHGSATTNSIRITWTPVAGALYYKVARYNPQNLLTPEFESGWFQDAFFNDVNLTPGFYWYSVTSSPDGSIASAPSPLFGACTAYPDMSFFQPASWSPIAVPHLVAPIVWSHSSVDIETYQGTLTNDVDFELGEVGHFYGAFKNIGADAAIGPDDHFVVRLLIKDANSNAPYSSEDVRYSWDLCQLAGQTIAQDEIKYFAFDTIFSAAGTYKYAFQILESPRPSNWWAPSSNNWFDYASMGDDRTITVHAPDLTPFAPPGWDASIVVNHFTPESPNRDNISVITPGVPVSIFWAVKNIGDLATPPNVSVQVSLYLDSETQPLCEWSHVDANGQAIPLNPGEVFSSVPGFSYTFTNLQLGAHVFRLVIDYPDHIREGIESNNSIMTPPPAYFVYQESVQSSSNLRRSSLGYFGPTGININDMKTMTKVIDGDSRTFVVALFGNYEPGAVQSLVVGDATDPSNPINIHDYNLGVVAYSKKLAVYQDRIWVVSNLIDPYHPDVQPTIGGFVDCYQLDDNLQLTHVAQFDEHINIPGFGLQPYQPIDIAAIDYNTVYINDYNPAASTSHQTNNMNQQYGLSVVSFNGQNLVRNYIGGFHAEGNYNNEPNSGGGKLAHNGNLTVALHRNSFTEESGHAWVYNGINFIGSIPGSFIDVEISGNIVVLASSNGSGTTLYQYDLSNGLPESPVSMFSYNGASYQTSDISSFRSYAYVSNGSGGISMIDTKSSLSEVGCYRSTESTARTNTVHCYATSSPSEGEYLFEGLTTNETPSGTLLRITKVQIPIVYSPNGSETITVQTVPVTWNGHTTEQPSNVRFYLYPNCQSQPAFRVPSINNNLYQNSGTNSIRFFNERHQIVFFPHARIGVQVFQGSGLPNADWFDQSDRDFVFDTRDIITPYEPVSTAYDIRTPVIIPPGITLNIASTADISFFGDGKIIVQGVLQFLGRSESSSPDEFTTISANDPDWPVSGAVIEVSQSGQIVGKHAKFENMPLAILNNGGKVFLDSMEFNNCATAIHVSTLIDTVALSHCSFSGGDKAVTIEGSGSVNQHFAVRRSHFINQHKEALYLYKVPSALIDGCEIVGDDALCTGINLIQCPDGVQVNNSEITQCLFGVNSLYSNARFFSDIISGNVNAGFWWSNDYPGTSQPGKIDHCTITNNGLPTSNFQAGFYGYACSPIFTCNLFAGNNNVAVYLNGNASPAFYDPDYAKNGANDFSGIEEYPIIVIDDAAPYFYYGENIFHPIFDEGGNRLNSYIHQFGKILTYDLSQNEFDDSPEVINAFEPPDSEIWLLSGIGTASVCGTNLGDYMSDLGGKLMRGDLYFSQAMLDSALANYERALVESGDSTVAGAAALERLSKLNPELPPVADPYTLTKLYNQSYGYDALYQFLTADAYRDSILAYGNHDDSLRIRYDLLVSSLLRASSDSRKKGEVDAQGIALVQAERSELFTQLLKPIAKHNHRSTSRIDVLPTKYALHPVYPNPFNSITNIRFDLPEANHVKISVYDAMGRLVTNLVDGNQNAGYHNVQWNGSTVSSGVYFVTIHTNKYTATRKAVLLK